MIPFPVFVILKLKTFDWCARQQSLQTPQVTIISHAMPGKTIKTSLTLENHGWDFALNTKLMYHHFIWWLIGILSKLKKKKKRPTGTRTNYFKLRCVCLWLCLLTLVDACTWRCLGDRWLCSLLYPTKVSGKNNTKIESILLLKHWKHKTHSSWFDAGTERISHNFFQSVQKFEPIKEMPKR